MTNPKTHRRINDGAMVRTTVQCGVAGHMLYTAITIRDEGARPYVHLSIYQIRKSTWLPLERTCLRELIKESALEIATHDCEFPDVQQELHDKLIALGNAYGSLDQRVRIPDAMEHVAAPL